LVIIELSIVKDGGRGRSRNEGRRIASMKLVDIFVVVVVFISRNAKTL